MWLDMGKLHSKCLIRLLGFASKSLLLDGNNDDDEMVGTLMGVVVDFRVDEDMDKGMAFGGSVKSDA